MTLKQRRPTRPDARALGVTNRRDAAVEAMRDDDDDVEEEDFSQSGGGDGDVDDDPTAADDEATATLDETTALKALRLFVRSALDESKRGGTTAHRGRYYELLDAVEATYRNDEVTADGRALMEAMCSHAAAFDERAHEQLIEKAFLRVDVWRCAKELREYALRLGTSLTCAHGGVFAATVVGKIVESFNAPVGFVEKDGGGVGQTATTTSMAAATSTSRVVTKDLTRGLANILRLVPLSRNAAATALRVGMPHKSAPKDVQIQFISAAFELVETESGSVLRDDFLKVVVAHLLEVDVEIKWDDVMKETDRTSADHGAKREEEEDDAIFELDDIEKTIEEHFQAEWEQRPATVAPLDVDEAADTLDALMELTLAHIDKRIEHGEIALVRESLMQAFSATLLPAPRSKFVQFLMFHVCAKDYQTCVELTELLFTKLTDVTEAASTRLAAAAYFASFLARAKYLDPVFVCELLKRLVDWCSSHVKQRTTPGSAALSGAVQKTKLGMPPPAPNQTLAVFDSACQATMYVLCYRAEDILRDGGGQAAATLRSLPLCEVLYSHLRPLLTCLPSVVTEFLHRAVAANITGFTEMLLKEHMDRTAEGRETDVSSNMPLARKGSMEFTSTQVAANSRNRFPLRMFFPFDPYVLRRSSALLQLEETYVFWTGSEIDRYDESDEEELALSSSSDDEEDDDDEAMENVSKSSMSDQARSFGVGSLNPRPRKLTRGLRQPKPVFGRAGESPSFGRNSGPSPSPGSANGFGALRHAQFTPNSLSPQSLFPRNQASQFPQVRNSTPPRVMSFDLGSPKE